MFGNFLSVLQAFFFLVSFILTVVAFLYAYIVSDPTSSRREWFSKGPMGLRFSGTPRKGNASETKEKKPSKFLKAHAIVNVKGGAYDEWIKQLPRSARQTLTKQVPKRFQRENIQVRRKRSRDLTFRHWLIVLDHERRSYMWPRALLASIMRFIVASLMVGSVDEFWKVNADTGTETFLAWSQSIVKGKTYRAMWFYQTKEASAGKYFIWFKSLDLAVSRSFRTTGVEFVDLGPSLNKNVIEIKEKFGFQNRLDWKNVCGYNDGPFREIE
eukprot:g7898.t1